MACCSDDCKKKFECALHFLNIDGDCYVEDYSHFGAGTYTDNECRIEHWCGKLGDYKMFEPIEKILFPFQYLEAYLLGEMDFDAAIDSTIEEADRLIEEYLKRHK